VLRPYVNNVGAEAITLVAIVCVGGLGRAWRWGCARPLPAWG